jgi:hypothetical protein
MFSFPTVGLSCPWVTYSVFICLFDFHVTEESSLSNVGEIRRYANIQESVVKIFE